MATRRALGDAVRSAAGARRVILCERGRAPGWGRLAGASATILTAPVSDDALRAAIGADGASVFLDGAGALGGWAFLERTEARLARLRAQLPGGTHLTVLDPTLAARAAEVPAGRDPALDRLRAAWSLPAPAVGAHRLKRALWRLGALAVLLLAVLPLVAGPFIDSSVEAPLIIGDPAGRIAGSLWLDAWVAEAFARGDAAALVTSDEIWWPIGADLAATFGTIGPAVLAAPFVLALGYPAFWNPFVTLALLLNGAAAAAFARSAGAARGPALLAGLAVAVAPPALVAAEEGRQAQFLAFFLPLALRSGMRALDGQRRADAHLTFLWTLAAGLVWWVYGALAATILGIALVHRALRDAPARPTLLANVRRAAHVFVPIGGLALVPSLVGFQYGQAAALVDAGSSVLDVQSQGTQARLEEVARGAVTVEQLFLGGGSLPGYGLQTSLLLLLLATLVLSPRARRPGPLVVAAILGVLSLGPWVAWEGTDYTAPWDWLYRWLPLFARSGVPSWLLLPGAAFVTLWFALFLSDLPVERPRVRATLGGIVALALAFGVPFAAERAPLARFEFLPPDWAEYLGEPGGVVIVPIAGNDLPLAWQRLHGHPIAFGPSASLTLRSEGPIGVGYGQDRVLRFLTEPGQPYFPGGSLLALWDQGLRWVVVDERRLETLMSQGQIGRWVEVVTQVDAAFGPARYVSDEVRIYSVRDAVERAAGADAAASVNALAPL